MAVIMAVVDADDRLLLARGKGFRGNGMSVLAGFVEPGETLAAAVAREVLEEVGIEVTDVTYLGDQPWPFPSSLMLGFTSRALDTRLRLQPEEIEAARWFTRDELAAAVADGSVAVSGRLSISRRIIEHWYGGPIDAPGRRPPPVVTGSGAGRQARRSRTCVIDGFVAALPSGKSRVGTVWLPPLTDMTYSAVPGSCSMSTSVKPMPSRSIWDFRRRQ